MHKIYNFNIDLIDRNHKCTLLTFVVNSSTKRRTIPGLGCIIIPGAGVLRDFQFSMIICSFNGFLTIKSFSFFTVTISLNVTFRFDAFGPSAHVLLLWSLSNFCEEVATSSSTDLTFLIRRLSMLLFFAYSKKKKLSVYYVFKRVKSETIFCIYLFRMILKIK